MIKEIVRNLKAHPHHMLALGISAIVMASISQLESDIGRLVLALLVLIVPSTLILIQFGKRKKVNVFTITSDDVVNKEAYEFWEGKFKEAKKSIYFTGDGFPRSDAKSIDLAQKTVNSMKSALDNGIHVLRLQTTPTTCPEHVEMLVGMINDNRYRDLLELYVLSNKQHKQITDVLCIDPTSAENCLAEILLPSAQKMGSVPVSLAGTSISIEAHQNLALDIREGILELCKDAVKLGSEEDIRKYLRPRKYYFAYGANMDEKTMLRRARSAEREAIGVLMDHKIVFSVPGKSRVGTVAGILKSPGDRVYGVIWSLAEYEFDRLDEIEDLTTYSRVDIDVTKENEEGAITCAVYEAVQMIEGRPDKKYVESILNAANEQKLPPEYIEEIEKIGRSS